MGETLIFSASLVDTCSYKLNIYFTHILKKDRLQGYQTNSSKTQPATPWGYNAATISCSPC